MSLSVVSITLNIRNNRTYPQRINVLGSPVNPLDTANALTEYRWDITSYAPSASDTLVLEYKPVGAAVFSTFTYQLSNANAETLVAALNQLGIGYFNYYTELGQNYLSTNNDDYVFGTLTINNNVPPTPTTSTTTTTTTAAPTTSTTSTTTTAAPTTTSTTTTTTTAAPTTTTTSTTSTTTTAAPTTTSTTTTTTTAAPTTSTTTTTTTLANFSDTIGFGGAPEDACGFLASGSVVGDAPTFCACTTFTGAIFSAAATGTWYVSFGGQYVSVSVTNGNPVATVTSACTTCPTPTTTSTTTTTTTAPVTTTSTTTTTTTAGSVQNFRSVTPQINSGNACAQSAPTSIYSSLSEPNMANGITLYSDAALTTPFNGNSQWFKIFWKGAIGFDDVYGVQIDSNGVVLNFVFCPTTTTTTTTTSSTTTTTTAAIINCTQWTNLSGVDAFYDWTDCDGTIHLNEAIANNLSICAQDGTVSFISGGTLTQQSSCGVYPPTTTSTTTTTTTAAPPISLYIASTTGDSCSGINGTTLPTYLYTGTPTLCGCTAINGANISGLPLGTYYISDGTDVRQFQKTSVGATMTATAACTSCPASTSTTTTTTTSPVTTSTTSTTTTLFTNLVFDATVGVGGYTIGAIDVNSVTPTLTGGTNVPFSTDTHSFNTDQVGTNETLNIFVSAFSLNGCITVTDSASNVFQQNITGTGTYSFAGLTIDNITAVNVICADNVC